MRIMGKSLARTADIPAEQQHSETLGAPGVRPAIRDVALAA
jgi:hypothetical protein